MSGATDLFGQPCPSHRRRPSRGYAARPGGGPAGETCGSCAFVIRHGRRRTHFKCARINWTFGAATDIKARAPACEFWEES